MSTATGMSTGMSASMDDAIYKLTSWLSPAYPVGAYTYSHGLETAIGAGDVTDPATAEAWIADCLRHGAGRSDAILLACAYRAAATGSCEAVREVADLVDALSPSSERLLETTAQGAAFARVTDASWGRGTGEAPPYPVAVGLAAARHAVPLEMTTGMFLHAFASNLISACVRLVPLGQTDGQNILAALMPVVRQVSGEAQKADIDDLGGFAFGSDIASLNHETKDVRLFRS